MIDPTPPQDTDAPLGSSLNLAPGVTVSPSLVRFAFSRSGGPGGQNVNKVATKAELRMSVADLPIREGARRRLIAMAGRKVTEAGELVIVSESERSQGRNRDECLEKLRELLVQATAEPKIRRKTKPTKGSKERRIKEKKSRSDIKRGRSGSHE